jgi:HAMP domain-containing protein
VTAPALLTSPGSLDAPLGGQQLEVQVVDRDERLARALAGPRRSRVFQSSRSCGGSSREGRARYARVEARLRRAARGGAARGGRRARGRRAVAAAASTHDISSTLGSVHLFVFLGALAAAALAAIVLAVLMGRALSPLGRLARSAAEIERTGDPSRRLPEPTSGDELVGLTRTLNAMLASLERARDTERRFLADASHELRTPLTARSATLRTSHGTALSGAVAGSKQRAAAGGPRTTCDPRVRATTAPPEVRATGRDRTRGRGGRHRGRRPEAVIAGHRLAFELRREPARQLARYGPPDGRISVGCARRRGGDSERDRQGLQPYEAARASSASGAGVGHRGSVLNLRAMRAPHGGAPTRRVVFTIELPALKSLRSSATTRP